MIIRIKYVLIHKEEDIRMFIQFVKRKRRLNLLIGPINITDKISNEDNII